MPEQSGVEFLIDTQLIGSLAEDVLQRARGNAFISFGEQQRAFFTVPQLQIVFDNFTKAVGQYHAALPASFFSDPDKAA